MQLMIDLIFCQASLYAHHVTMWSTLDGQLYDIPLTEWLYKREYRPRLHLHIGDLADDMSAVKMTGFNVSQLRRLYNHFGLREFVQAHNETVLRIVTGHWSNGLEKCYRIHPEELFLFSLTKCKTGMTNERIIDMFFGGDYAQWSHSFRWFILYLDLRYRNIVGHAGLLRFLPQFGYFRDKIGRIDGTTITRAMSHGCLDWRSCPTIYSAGLMIPSIEFVCHSQALKAISLVHHDECSTLTHRSRFILGRKVCMGLRLRQCYCQMV